MADKTNRYEDNAPGAWYVDTACIDCDLCREYAPLTFAASDDRDHHRIIRQPVTSDELKAAEDARIGCPVDAIGNDG
jgi:ferredoxin